MKERTLDFNELDSYFRSCRDEEKIAIANFAKQGIEKKPHYGTMNVEQFLYDLVKTECVRIVFND